MVKRAATALRAWRWIPPSEREQVKRKARAVVAKSMKSRKYKPPTGAEWATIVKDLAGIVLAPRTARKEFGGKAAIVSKWRQAKSSMKSKRQAAYLRWCAAEGVAPGTLSGVDGRVWP